MYKIYHLTNLTTFLMYFYNKYLTSQLARHVVATWCICGIYVGVYGTLMPRSYT